MTVLWSEGAASFEPYHVEGVALEAFHESAQQARQSLAAALESDFRDAADELATLGDQLYRSLFQLDHASPAAQAVHGWWRELQTKNAVDSLEVLSDRPGSIPWNLVYEPPPDGSAARDVSGSSPAIQPFWGNRFALGVGRRVNPHRVFPFFEKPDLLVALDPASADPLPSDLRQQFDQLVAYAGGNVVNTFDALTERLRRQAPDVLVIFCRLEDGRILLGDGRGCLRQLRQALAETEAGNPQPLVLLLGNGPADAAASWESLLGSATRELSSIVAPEIPGGASTNIRLGMTCLRSFLGAGDDLGSSLRQARQELGLAGLAYSAFCPPYLRVLHEGREPDADLPAPALQELPEQPYRGLAPFDREDRALFVGREDETARFARLLDDAGTRGVLLHGAAGVGKASFLRAGVLPYLEDDGLGYLALRDRSDTARTQAERDHPTLALRAGGDLAGQLALGLCAFCAQPFSYGTPAGTTVTVDLPAILTRHTQTRLATPSDAIQIKAPTGASTAVAAGAPHAGAPPSGTASTPVQLWEAFSDNPAVFTHLLEEITERLPFELVIVVEHGEDLIDEQGGMAISARRQAALAMLAQLSAGQARCKVMLSARTEAFGQLAEAFPAGDGRSAWREFYLPPLSAKALAEALLLPSATAPPLYAGTAPHQRYGISFGPGVADQIAKDAVALAPEMRVGAAAIAQATGALLATRARQRRETLIKPEHLRDLRSARQRPIDLALDRYVEQQLVKLPLAASTRRAVQHLLGKLYRRRDDGTLVRPLKPARELVQHWRGAQSLETSVSAASAPEVGLLEVQQLLVDGREGLYVGLGSDALAGWGARQALERERQQYARSRVIDALFILVPLAVLGVALTYYLMRGAVREQAEKVEAYEEEMQKKVVPLVQQFKAESDRVPGPLYNGAIAQADQALRAGNLLRARQVLLSQQPYANLQDDKQFDRRGFEWRYLWRQANPERHTLLGHRGMVNAVAASPDSSLMATGGADGKVMLWNLKRKGEVSAIFTAHHAPVLAVAFAPDGKTVASADADSLVHIWNVKIGVDEPARIDAAAKSLAGHTGPIHALAFGKEANRLVTASADHTVVLWDIAAGKPAAVLKEHTDAVLAVAVSPDGKVLASGGKDKHIVIYDAETGKKTATIPSAAGAVCLAFSSDSSTLISAANESPSGADLGVVRFWDPKSGKETASPIFSNGGAFHVAAKPNSTMVIVAAKDHAVRAWDYKTGKEALTLHGHLGWVNAIAVTPDGTTLATSSYDNTVKLWDWTSPSDVLTHGDWVQALAISNNDELLASGGRDGVVKIWRTASGEMLGEIKGHPGPVTALSFVPQVKEIKLIVGSWSDKGAGSVKLWELAAANGKLTAKEGPAYPGHSQGVQCLAVAKDGVFATGSADGTVIVWDSGAGAKKQTLTINQPIQCVAWSPSGTRLAIGDRQGNVDVWEMAAGELKKRGTVTSAHPGGVQSLVFRGEDFDFLSSGADQTLKQWTWKAKKDPTAGWVTRSHYQPVNCVALLSETAFVSGSWDRTVKLWELRDAGVAEERFTFAGHTGPVRALAASVNRQFLASAGHDGTIRMWRASAPPAARK
jgi:WD40 repeat protein